MAPLRTLVFLAAVAMSVTALPATGVHIRRDETEAVGSVISAVGVSVAPVVGADDTNVDDELLADDFTGFEGDSTDDVFPREPEPLTGKKAKREPKRAAARRAKKRADEEIGVPRRERRAKKVAKREEVKREEVKREEVKREEVKREEVKREEVKREEVKREEVKREEVKRQEGEVGVPRRERRAKKRDPEEVRREEVKREEVKREEVKREEV